MQCNGLSFTFVATPRKDQFHPFFSIQNHTLASLEQRPEGEVVEVLVHGVAGGEGAWVGGLVDEHGVHGHDVRAREALHIVQDLHTP